MKFITKEIYQEGEGNIKNEFYEEQLSRRRFINDPNPDLRMKFIKKEKEISCYDNRGVNFCYDSRAASRFFGAFVRVIHEIFSI